MPCFAQHLIKSAKLAQTRVSALRKILSFILIFQMATTNLKNRMLIRQVLINKTILPMILNIFKIRT